MTNFDVKNLTFGPGPLIIVSLVVLALMIFRPRQRARMIALQACFISVLLAYTMPLVSEFLSRPLLARAQRLQKVEAGCRSEFQVVVVLGGGIHSPDLPSVAAQERLIEAAKLLRELAGSGHTRHVVLSGGPTLSGESISEAAIALKLLKSWLGPEVASMHEFLIEEKSLNTYENARFSAELIEARRLSKDIVLVTSELHMPRAFATFEKAGFRVCAVASPWRGPHHLLSFKYGEHLFAVLNEWLGAIGYKLRGWT